ncbi:hypothetical protein C8F01DRAFT_1156669 [Mycena amicta]|nr:hypothetical protein C8F01DRAFT_1156669 [Mycena amicta]
MPLHPALQLAALDALPLTIRVNRIVSCARTAPPTQRGEHIERAILRMRSFNTGQKMAILPMLYSLLDPARLPTIDEIDAGALSESRVVLSICYQTPVSLGRDLWPRLWAWFEFCYLTWEKAFWLPMERRVAHYEAMLLLAALLHTTPHTRQLLHSTPGFHIYLGKTWQLMCSPTREHEPHDESMLYALSNLFDGIDPSQTGVLDDLIEGVGGSFDHLAQCVLEFIDSTSGVRRIDFTEDSHSRRGTTPGKLIYSICRFAAKVDQETMVETPIRPDHYGMGKLTIALISGPAEPLLSTLIATVLNLCQDAAPNALTAISYFLPLFINALHSASHISYAVNNGLFRALFTTASLNFDLKGHSPDGRDPLLIVLQRIIPVGCFDYDLLKQIVAAVGAMDAEVELHLKGSEFSISWRKLQSFLYERGILWKSVDRQLRSHDQATSLVKICDNLQCGKVDSSSRLRRCSSCQTAYYCSKSCQIADWRNGNHRKWCGAFEHMILGSHIEPHFPFRARHVIRAYVHAQYLANFDLICAKKLKARIDYPQGGPFATFFDFVNIVDPMELEVEVIPLTELLTSPDFGFHRLRPSRRRVRRDALLSRVDRSGGRFEIHAVNVCLGGYELLTTVLVPMRSSSAVLSEVLESLARPGSLIWENKITETTIRRKIPSFRALVPGLLEYH